jgi:hypothetical protein
MLALPHDRRDRLSSNRRVILLQLGVGVSQLVKCVLTPGLLAYKRGVQCMAAHN